MRTTTQREASRLNAIHSTGPRTPEGKARSAMNALTTGIQARSAVVFGESTAGYTALTDEYYQHHHPVTPQQRALIDTLITCEWQRRRMVYIEPEVWMEQASLNTYVATSTRAEFRGRNVDSRPGRAWLAADQQLMRIQRRLDALHHTYISAMKELQALQLAETAGPEISTEQPIEESPLNPSSASFSGDAASVLPQPLRQAA